MNRPHAVRLWLVGLSLASVALTTVVAAHRALSERQQLDDKMQVALTLADAAAQAAAGPRERRTGLLADIAARRPDVVVEVVVAERTGELDRALRLTHPAEANPPLALAAQRIADAAARALQSGERLTANTEVQHLPSGMTVVAAAFRAEPGGREVAGVAGVVLAPASTPPWPLWPALVAAIVAFGLPWLLTRAPLPPPLTGAIALAVTCLAVVGALPSLGPSPSAGVVVLAADWLVPHAPWPVEALPARWLQVAVVSGWGAIFGALVPRVAGWPAKPVRRAPAG